MSSPYWLQNIGSGRVGSGPSDTTPESTPESRRVSGWDNTPPITGIPTHCKLIARNERLAAENGEQPQERKEP
jgi:hypothetical protein